MSFLGLPGKIKTGTAGTAPVEKNAEREKNENHFFN